MSPVLVVVLAAPVVSSSFNIINWIKSEMQIIDAKRRKLLTLARVHHLKADVDRIYIPRKEGGRSLIQLEMSLKTTTIGLDTHCTYLQETKADVDRIYIPGKEGGRGLIQLEMSLKTTTIGLDTYLQETKDSMLTMVREHNLKKKLTTLLQNKQKSTGKNLTCQTWNQLIMNLPQLMQKELKPMLNSKHK